MKTLLGFLLLTIFANTALADDGSCALYAELIMDGAKLKPADLKGIDVLIVTVSKDICVETSSYPGMTIGDTNAWKVDVAVRDKKHRVLMYRITPMVKNSSTSLFLRDAEGHVFTLMLKSSI